MHCLTAWGQWTVQLLQCTAALPGGSGQCNSCNALPQHRGAAGNQGLVQCAASVPWGQWAAQISATHRLTTWGAVGSATRKYLQYTAALSEGSGQRISCNALPHCLGAVGSATPAIHCRTVRGQWAAQLLQCTASLPWGQWALELLQCTAPNPCNALPHCPGGSRQCNSCNALPHCLGAVDSATAAMHCLTAWGQWAVDLQQYTAPLPGGSGQWNSCNALPHCLGVGSNPAQPTSGDLAPV